MLSIADGARGSEYVPEESVVEMPKQDVELRWDDVHTKEQEERLIEATYRAMVELEAHPKVPSITKAITIGRAADAVGGLATQWLVLTKDGFSIWITAPFRPKHTGLHECIKIFRISCGDVAKAKKELEA